MNSEKEISTKNELFMEKPIPKLSTAIPGFDAISYGGLPAGRSTLIAGTSGSAKTIFAIQYLYQGIKACGETGVFVTFEETPADIVRNVASFGWDLTQCEREQKLAFVDLSPEPDEAKLDSGEYDLVAMLIRIEHAVKKVGAKTGGN